MDGQYPALAGVAGVVPRRSAWRDSLRRLRPGLLTMLGAPALLWLAQALYLPVLAPALGTQARWLVASGIVALAGLSLVAHALAHVVVARRLGVEQPAHIPLGPLGDVAQVWPSMGGPRREALVALAGPGVSAALAALAGLLWLAQLAPWLDAVALSVAALNGVLAALNLAPCAPFDGGRLVRLALQGAAPRPERLAVWLGWAMAGALLAWGGYVVATRSRFSGETGAALGALAALIALALAGHAPLRAPGAPPAGRAGLRRGLAALMGAALLAPALAIAPTPYGLYAPGGAVPVAPMVEVSGVSPEPSEGALLLTTVIGQTPILAGQWLAGQLDPAVTIVPPEQVVPPETSPQELMAGNARMLDESELVATAVALGLAGLDVAGPPSVHIRPHSIIGGPSAGLMFTLAIYDRLTPGDLTGGLRIAGTGTISRDGRVGPIGGVAQKVAAAERAGAAYFLVPQENAAEARRVARRITVIAVSNVADALAALRGLAPLG